MGRTAIALAVVCLLVAPAALAQGVYCDDMETGGLWTFWHWVLDYDGIWYARYTDVDSHSATHSIETSLHGGGAVGRDSDRAVASRIFTLGGGDPVCTVSVWYSSMEFTSTGLLDGVCYLRVIALDAAQEVLAGKGYIVLAFDDNSDEYWEHNPSYIYQEERPEEYEEGAPYYCRSPSDGSILPPEGWWYKLEVHPDTDLVVDWEDVEYLEVELVTLGCFMHLDDVGMLWDDLCYTVDTCPVQQSSWGGIKALFQ